MIARKIRVLVVDDSQLVREMIGAIVAEEPDMEVVGEAADGLQAVRLAATLRPDIITMDIEMPVLNGFGAIERIMAERPAPILVVTALTGARTAFSAMAKGALEVLEKPDISLSNAGRLVQAIRQLAGVDAAAHLAKAARGGSHRPALGQPPAPERGNGAAIVAIAASTGGPQAIHGILGMLPATFPLPVVIAQHIADGFAQAMVDWLAGSTRLQVKLARDGDLLAAGTVHVNPSEYAMHIENGGRVRLAAKDHQQSYSPSCNVLLGSVAAAYRARAIGLILSGMGDDGVAGIQAIKQAGGATLAQDAASSVVYGMNQCAVARGLIDRVLPLAEIPAELLNRAGSR